MASLCIKREAHFCYLHNHLRLHAKHRDLFSLNCSISLSVLSSLFVNEISTAAFVLAWHKIENLIRFLILFQELFSSLKNNGIRWNFLQYFFFSKENFDFFTFSFNEGKTRHSHICQTTKIQSKMLNDFRAKAHNSHWSQSLSFSLCSPARMYANCFKFRIFILMMKLTIHTHLFVVLNRLWNDQFIINKWFNST